GQEGWGGGGGVGEFQAFGERQRLVVPWRLPVVAVFERPRRGRDQPGHQCSVRPRRKGGDARPAKLKKAGEEAIEPSPLLRGERGAIGNQFRNRRAARLSDSTACCSDKAFNASNS